MSETPAISDVSPAAIGPGRLVLVVGPSGAGKDTLIDLARAACAGDANIVFPRRVVTREATAFEDNAQVSFEAFRQARDNGEFAVHWEAHGHGYALPRAIDDEIREGHTVVANVSRTVIEPMRRAYADVVVVSITAPAEILEPASRGPGARQRRPIADRLGRAVDGAAAAPDVTIDNVGSAETHAQELLRIIRGG